MSKKILILDGSFRKKNTYNLLLQIERILNRKGYETEIINLFDVSINDCIGCEACVSGTRCGQIDDMSALMKKFMDSDGVVLSSPVYLNSVSSRFKTFADRTNAWTHKPEPVGKPVMFVTTSAFTGINETRRFFSSFATTFGGRKGDFIARIKKNWALPVQEKELRKFLSLLEKDKKYYKPANADIIMFTVQKVLSQKADDDNKKFWVDRQWLDKSYYYPCKINIFKKLFGKFMYKVISGAMG